MHFIHSECQVPSLSLSILLELGLGYQCHFSWGPSMTSAAFMDGFLETGLWLTWETVLICEWGKDENKTLIGREIQQYYDGKGIHWLALTPFLLPWKQATVLSMEAPSGVAQEDWAERRHCPAEQLYFYSQLVHLCAANVALTLQTDQSCDLLSARWWEPPLALPIFKQLKLFCISKPTLIHKANDRLY